MAQPLRNLFILATCYFAVQVSSQQLQKNFLPEPLTEMSSPGGAQRALTPTDSGVPISRPTTPVLPHASGTIDNCFVYRNYREVPPMMDQLQSSEVAYSDFVNSCGYLTILWETTIDDLVRWNPSLNKDNCTMQAGFSYCVLESEEYRRPGKSRNLCYFLCSF